MKILVTGGNKTKGKTMGQMQIDAVRARGRIRSIVAAYDVDTIWYADKGHVAGEALYGMAREYKFEPAESVTDCDFAIVVTPCPADVIRELVDSGTRFLQV